MLDSNLAQFTEKEGRELDNSFDPSGLRVRIRYAFLGGVITLAVAVGLYSAGASAFVLFLALLTFAGIYSIEKSSYIRAQAHSHSLVHKLVHRIEELEGVPATADNARPSVQKKPPVAAS